MPGRDVVIPPGTEASYDRHHFAAAVRAGGLLLCSGQIGVLDGVVPTDPEQQFTVAFEAVGRVLAAAGCGFEDVAEISTFHVGYPRELDTFMRVKDRYLASPWPAWTAVGVAALSRPELLVEIKAVAVLPR